MALDFGDRNLLRNLLSDIFRYKPNKEIAIKKRLFWNGFIEILQELHKKNIIKDLTISRDDLENDLYGYDDNEKGTVYNIRFTVQSWQKLNKFARNEFDKLITEPYGKDKQLKIIQEVIINKALELENNQFRISDNDFYVDEKHIVFFEMLNELEKEGWLKLLDATYYTDSDDFKCDIKLLKDIKELKNERNEQNKQQSQEKKEVLCSQKFRFNQGVLFRDFCDGILIIKGENTQEYRLLQTAIALPVRERIDKITDNIDMNWRQLYDTAGRLNAKIKDIFKVDNFFQTDFPNKNLHRTVE